MGGAAANRWILGSPGSLAGRQVTMSLRSVSPHHWTNPKGRDGSEPDMLQGKLREKMWGKAPLERTPTAGGGLPGVRQDRHDEVPVLSNDAGDEKPGGDPGGEGVDADRNRKVNCDPIPWGQMEGGRRTGQGSRAQHTCWVRWGIRGGGVGAARGRPVGKLLRLKEGRQEGGWPQGREARAALRDLD